MVFGVEREIDVQDFPSEEEIIVLENMMPPLEHGWFDSAFDSAKLHYRKWMPTSAPNAVVIYMHGILSHSGRSHDFGPDGRKINMSLTASFLLEENCALYAFDLYGHGFSEGTRFLIPGSGNSNTQDLINFVRLVAEAHKDVPMFLMAESYGANLSLQAAKHFQEQRGTAEAAPENFDSLVLLSPSVEADLPGFPLLQILQFLALIFPRWSPFFMPDGVAPDLVWRDPAVVELRTDQNNAATKLDGTGTLLRLGTASNIVDALENVKNEAIPGLDIPFMILQGTEDAVAPIAGAEFLFANAATVTSDKEFLRKEGAFHDLTAEPDSIAEECLQDVANWINKRLGVL